MPTSSRRAASTHASGASSRSSKSSPMSEHDDEILGKAYGARLMRRVWSCARPHRRIIFLSMALFPLVAAFELLQPWLTKIAIDRYILPGDWAGLTWGAAAYLACLLGLYALRVAVSYLTQLAGQRVMHDLPAAPFPPLHSQGAPPPGTTPRCRR